MRAILRYTILRALVFAIVFVGLWVVAAGSVAVPLIALLALVVSAIISFSLFRREREAVAGEVAQRVGRVRARIDAATRAEDDD